MRIDLTALLAGLAACAGGRVDDVQVEVSTLMPTVVRVTWTTASPTTGFVAFGEADGLTRHTAADPAPATEHHATLVALPAETEISLQVQGDAESKMLTVTTGAFDSPLPPIDVEGSGQDHFLVMPLLAAADQFPAIIDPQGRIVWITRDLRPLQVFRSRVSRDGSGVVYSSVLDGGDAAPGSAIVRVDWEGQPIVVHEVDYLAHDFVELDDGTLVSLAAEFRGDGKDRLEGNKLVAIAPDGTTEDLWSSWDCFDPVANPSEDPNRPGEWTHANALDYDRARDAFVIGFRNLGTLAQVDRATGTCDWAFGGTGGNVAVNGPRFRYQHQFEWTEGGMLVFDNQGAQGFASRVLDFDFDADARTADLVRDIRADPELFTFILGDVHRFGDGDLMIAWGETGIADRVGADGQRRWRMAMVNDVNLGFVEVLADPGRPTDPE